MATKIKDEQTAPLTGNPTVFRKEKILTLTRYAARRDLLSALLAEGKDYTLEQVDGLIQEFMKGKVN